MKNSSHEQQDPVESKPSKRDLEHTSDVDSETSRRTFLGTASSTTMAAGLVAGYGTLGFFTLRFVMPESVGANLGWQFVTTLDRLKGKPSYEFTASSGVKIIIARTADDSAGDETVKDTAESFVALSSICPHLGCQVYWESNNDRFFCPCHNGTFDAGGKATSGPPADANQSLTQFPLKVINDALYVEAPLKSVTKAGNEEPA